jgi:hypothetical protein
MLQKNLEHTLDQLLAIGPRAPGIPANRIITALS